MFRGHLISLVYGITALFFGALALFEESEVLNIAFKDTYLVIPKSFLWLVLTCIFLFLAGIAMVFELFKKPMNKYLFGIHFLVTIISLLIIYFTTQQQETPQDYSDYSGSEDLQNQAEAVAEEVQWIVYAVYALVGAQIVFALNIIISIFKTPIKPQSTSIKDKAAN